MRLPLTALVLVLAANTLPAQTFFAGLNLPGFRVAAWEPAPCAAPRIWIPGHYERRCEKVWVAGATRQVWVEPEYQCVTDAWGRVHRILVRHGYFRTACEPGRFEDRERYVWVEGRYVDRRHRT